MVCDLLIEDICWRPKALILRFREFTAQKTDVVDGTGHGYFRWGMPGSSYPEVWRRISWLPRRRVITDTLTKNWPYFRYWRDEDN
jgi:hypothetical protein